MQADLHFKKRKRKSAGMEWVTEPSPIIFTCEEKAIITALSPGDGTTDTLYKECVMVLCTFTHAFSLIRLYNMYVTVIVTETMRKIEDIICYKYQP